MPGRRRWNEIFVQVRHNKREETIIWTIGDRVMHERLLSEFEGQGFTGYRPLPAKVRFRDGSVSQEYREFIVTGWAGVAHPESGMRLVEICPACLTQTYGYLREPEKVVDWNQWTGDDFFVVWPFDKLVFVTERVAEFLKARAVKTFDLRRLHEWPNLHMRINIVGEPVSVSLPPDLAIQYGRPLGLA
jgi:hypothetical protein